MTDRKIIAVVGATGAQGGGLVRAILNGPSGGFAARAITRDLDSDNARALAELGAEDLGNMFQFKRDFNEVFCAARDIGVSRALNPELRTFKQWLAENRDRIPRA